MTEILRATNGAADGVAVTTANASAAQVTPGGGGTLAWATASGRFGDTGVHAVVASGASQALRFAMNAASNQAQWTFWYKTLAALPGSGGVTFFMARHSGGRCFSLLESSTGSIYLQPFSGAQTEIVAAGPLTRGQWIAIQITAVGASATASTATLKVYDTAGVQIGTTKNLTAQDFTANNFSHFDLSSGNVAADMSFYGARANDGAGAALAPYEPVNAAPTVSVTGVQNLATGATASITLSEADSDGTIASRNTTFLYPTSGAPTISGAGTTNPTFPVGATAGVLYQTRSIVTDDDGTPSAPADTEVRVPITTSTDVTPLPMDATKVGSWSRVGGSATDGAALADGSNATYLESSAVSGTEQKALIRLKPRTALGSGAQIGVTLWSDTGTTNWQIRLYEGATLRKTWTQTGVGSTATEYLFTIDDTTLGTISDWGNLRVEVGVTN